MTLPAFIRESTPRQNTKARESSRVTTHSIVKITYLNENDEPTKLILNMRLTEDRERLTRFVSWATGHNVKFHGAPANIS